MIQMKKLTQETMTHGSSLRKTSKYGNMESEFTMAAAAASGDRRQSRRRQEHEETPQDAIRPARYVNGVRLGDFETISIVLCCNT